MALRVGALGSLALHALAAGGLFVCARGGREAAPRAPTISVSVVPPSGAVLLPGPAAVLPLGAADHATPAPSSPAPKADVDVPDGRAAAAGGGAAGATAAWTGRHDREELRAQPWNDPSTYRLPRTRSGRERTTPEALPRRPDPGLDASERARARLQRRATPGAPAPGPGATRSVDGAAVAEPARPLVEAGARAVEAGRHGAAADTVAAAQASDERQPEAFDLTTPRAGGAEAGVAGPARGPGASEVEHGRDDGGTPLDVARGPGQPATRARLQDSYFRSLYARVIARVEWPRRLAVSLEQGEVVVAFTLNRDGSVAEVKVSRSSGFAEFDDAVVTAIRRAAPFGPVPEAVAEGAGGVRVSAPFVFDNPLIR